MIHTDDFLDKFKFHGHFFHDHCHHCKHYCSDCGVNYCCRCGKEFGQPCYPIMWEAHLARSIDTMCLHSHS